MDPNFGHMVATLEILQMTQTFASMALYGLIGLFTQLFMKLNTFTSLSKYHQQITCLRLKMDIFSRQQKLWTSVGFFKEMVASWALVH
jgi:hypothetical protein